MVLNLSSICIHVYQMAILKMNAFEWQECSLWCFRTVPLWLLLFLILFWIPLKLKQKSYNILHDFYHFFYVLNFVWSYPCVRHVLSSKLPSVSQRLCRLTATWSYFIFYNAPVIRLLHVHLWQLNNLLAFWGFHFILRLRILRFKSKPS